MTARVIWIANGQSSMSVSWWLLKASVRDNLSNSTFVSCRITESFVKFELDSFDVRFSFVISSCILIMLLCRLSITSLFDVFSFSYLSSSFLHWRITASFSSLCFVSDSQVFVMFEMIIIRGSQISAVFARFLRKASSSSVNFVFMIPFSVLTLIVRTFILASIKRSRLYSKFRKHNLIWYSIKRGPMYLKWFLLKSAYSSWRFTANKSLFKTFNLLSATSRYFSLGNSFRSSAISRCKPIFIAWIPSRFTKRFPNPRGKNTLLIWLRFRSLTSRFLLGFTW